MSRPFVELYLGGRKVEFMEIPQICMNYTQEELTNPTIIRNSFSKTITIEGTPVNNSIMGCFHDMTRITDMEDGNFIGAYFNPSRKLDFVLYRNGEAVERGYAKLDSVRKTGKHIQYNISLYGGLGQFLYGLAYDDEGNELKLSDLNYDVDIDISVDKDTVSRAWKYLTDPTPNVVNSTYDTINFAPCYNGIPDDFSTDKVAINSNSLPNEFQIYTSSGNYTTVDGWMLGELQGEKTEWEMKDLRSYHQRPVIRVKKIIEACCNPVNNGGYDVELDSDFFNSDNPYYEDTWMTLPLLTELENIGMEGEVTTSTDTTGNFIFNGLDEGDIFDVSVPYYVTSNADVKLQSNGYGYILMTGAYTFKRDTPLIAANMAIYSQLVIYDATGKAVYGSPVNSMYSGINKATNFTYAPEFNAPINVIYGTFHRAGDDVNYKYRFYNDYDIGSYVGGPLPVYSLAVEGVKYTEGMYMKLITKIAKVDNGTVKGYAGNLFWSEGYEAHPVAPKLSYNWYDPTAIKTKKGWKITKKSILATDYSPADFLISYIKTFNLHISNDELEKKVYIRTRENHFTGEKYDLDRYVDRDKDVAVYPLTFDAKWYDMQNEIEEGLLSADYQDKNGMPYGIKRIDTNYNFDNSHKDLLEGNVFKTAIMHRGMNRYYVDIYNPQYTNQPMPSFFLDGCQTILFNAEGDTTNGTYVTPKTSAHSVNWWSQKYYDLFPKPSFVDEKNSPIDGANVLLFFNGKKELKDNEGNIIYFHLTDDIPQFETLNENEPCWIYTVSNFDVAGNTIANTVYELPQFSRYITTNNGWITHSWDFGTPRTLYDPEYRIDNSSNIYDRYWKNYIQDRYDKDTRVVECNVRLVENVLGDWLRKFYYFDGSYWVMNRIIDYDASSNSTTKVELVKVKDLSDYRQRNNISE